MKIVFDLDGTICFKGMPISETILECLEQLKNEGHDIIFASARPIRDMLPVLHKCFHSYKLIGGNGSLISKTGNVEEAQAFSIEQMKNILSVIDRHKATYLIDGNWDYAYTGPQDHPILSKVDPSRLAKCIPVTALDAIVKILILTADNMDLVEQEIRDLNVVIHRHGDENVLDISPENVHKWSALQRLGVEEHAYIAFGNDANDITMFQKAAHSVMIGHHNDLAPHATESVSLEGNYERKIVGKIRELVSIYSQSEVKS